MIKAHIANMPFFPKTSKKSCPIGNASSVSNSLGTEAMENEAAIRTSHPRLAVALAPIMIAKGAAREAFVVSSLI